MKNHLSPLVIVVTLFMGFVSLSGQVTQENYDRARTLRSQFDNKVLYGDIRPKWIGITHSFWFVTTTPKGSEYFIVDGDTKSKRNLLDQEKLAKALTDKTGQKADAYDLRLTRPEVSEDLKTFNFIFDRKSWSYNLSKNRLSDGAPVPERRRNNRNWSEGRNELSGDPIISPDSVYEAFIRDYNVWVRKRPGGQPVKLSVDGVPGNYYSSYMYWSPDSKKLVANKYRPAWKRFIHYVESSPSDQVQPKYEEMEYAKPGDELPHQVPTLFHVDGSLTATVPETLISSQYDLSRFSWHKDSKEFTFEYNQRGHQVYRVIGIDAATGTSRIIIEETSPTFIHYSGKRYRHDLNDGKEIIWASERDNWNHLYLYDGTTGKVINQITRGEWPVRSVLYVDEANRQITFEASGREPGDPYLIHVYRINMDGTGLTQLTDGYGNHSVTFSSDRKLMTDSWSRVDEAPVTVLRSATDGSQLMEIQKADIRALLAAGCQLPEPFVAKGRDGKTDIWGVIIRPTNFDPNKKYPVIENIYAGPHSSFVPKTFRAYNGMMAYAELNFILVQIDGMGTSNRSKAFHDICWKNIGDAGFPDRILWMKAAAEKYPYMDISRVGIYGTSAGGQNAAGAVIFHPEFYDVAVSSCGCHDNRMDKIWWNEQWMGYPVGKEYDESSNVVNAHKLGGKLLLILGEMDKNVDPSSTMQLVNALIKANKDFDFLMVPGMGHSSGGAYGDHKRMDFFVRHLHGIEPPAWESKSN